MDEDCSNQTIPAMEFFNVVGVNPIVKLTHSPLDEWNIYCVKFGKRKSALYSSVLRGNDEIQIIHNFSIPEEIAIGYYCNVEAKSIEFTSDSLPRCRYCGCLIDENKTNCTQCGAPR